MEKNELEEKLKNASPHEIIALTYQGLLERLDLSKEAIISGDNDKKSEYINKSIAIVEALQESLDKDANPELYEKINELYEYMKERLYDAITISDIDYIDEVKSIALKISDAWNQIGNN